MVAAYVLISVAPSQPRDVVAALGDVQGVRQAHACWGQPDIFAFVEGSDEKVLADTVLTDIQAIPGVRSTETHIVIPT
jgi:DNA-binding Lrp family transcriptional regulator